MSLVKRCQVLSNQADRNESGVQDPTVVAAAVAKSRLQQSSYPEVRNVSCEVRDDVLILSGRVSSYYFKQLAQALVADANGAMQVNNQVNVPPWPDSDETEAVQWRVPPRQNNSQG